MPTGHEVVNDTNKPKSQPLVEADRHVIRTCDMHYADKRRREGPREQASHHGRQHGVVFDPMRVPILYTSI